MKKYEKIYYNIREKKKLNDKKYILSKIDNKKIKDKIKKHFEKYKSISEKKLREYLNIEKTYKQLKRENEYKEFYEKYEIKKVKRGFFGGKFWKYKNQCLKYFDLREDFRSDVKKKIFSGKKLSKKLQMKVEEYIQNKMTMSEKLLLVELAKLKMKKKKITKEVIERLRKKVEKKIEKLKKDLTPNKIRKFRIYDFIY